MLLIGMSWKAAERFWPACCLNCNVQVEFDLDSVPEFEGQCLRCGGRDIVVPQGQDETAAVKRTKDY